MKDLFKLFSLAVERSPCTIVITNRDGNIEYVNPQFFSHTGFTPDEVIGKNPRILKSGKTPPKVYQKMWQTILAGKVWRGELLNKNKNGELYWESASIASVTDAKGTITHFVGVFEDISARKKIEQLKEEFAGTVSHELRNPLAILKMSAEDLHDGLAGPLNKKQAEIVEIIRRNSLRLQRIINDILDLSRLESGRAIIRPAPIELTSVVKETIRNFQKSAPKIALKTDLPATLPVSTDPDMVVQILSNLLENAIRFAKQKVLVKAAGENGFVELIVIDDGPGIAEEDQQRLFSKFEQIHRPAYGTGYKGTGLGLAICKEIVSQLGGKIWVESIEGKGAKFHFTLRRQYEQKDSSPDR